MADTTKTTDATGKPTAPAATPTTTTPVTPAKKCTMLHCAGVGAGVGVAAGLAFAYLKHKNHYVKFGVIGLLGGAALFGAIHYFKNKDKA